MTIKEGILIHAKNEMALDKIDLTTEIKSWNITVVKGIGAQLPKLVLTVELLDSEVFDQYDVDKITSKKDIFLVSKSGEVETTNGNLKRLRCQALGRNLGEVTLVFAINADGGKVGGPG